MVAVLGYYSGIMFLAIVFTGRHFWFPAELSWILKTSCCLLVFLISPGDENFIRIWSGVLETTCRTRVDKIHDPCSFRVSFRYDLVRM